MRPLLLLASLSIVLGACGAGPDSTAHLRERPPVRMSAPLVAAPDLPDAAARACIARATTEPFPPFVAPVADDAFRAHLAARVGELRCCFTDARLEALEGARVELTFAPRTDDPHDGATATLDAPLGEARPNEARCLVAITSRWTITTAPVSDVLRTPLDPRQSAGANAASVRIAYPL